MFEKFVTNFFSFPVSSKTCSIISLIQLDPFKKYNQFYNSQVLGLLYLEYIYFKFYLVYINKHYKDQPYQC